MSAQRRRRQRLTRLPRNMHILFKSRFANHKPFHTYRWSSIQMHSCMPPPPSPSLLRCASIECKSCEKLNKSHQKFLFGRFHNFFFRNSTKRHRVPRWVYWTVTVCKATPVMVFNAMWLRITMTIDNASSHAIMFNENIHPDWRLSMITRHALTHSAHPIAVCADVNVLQGRGCDDTRAIVLISQLFVNNVCASYK